MPSLLCKGSLPRPVSEGLSDGQSRPAELKCSSVQCNLFLLSDLNPSQQKDSAELSCYLQQDSIKIQTTRIPVGLKDMYEALQNSHRDCHVRLLVRSPPSAAPNSWLPSIHSPTGKCFWSDSFCTRSKGPFNNCLMLNECLSIPSMSNQQVCLPVPC